MFSLHKKIFFCESVDDCSLMKSEHRIKFPKRYHASAGYCGGICGRLSFGGNQIYAMSSVLFFADADAGNRGGMNLRRLLRGERMPAGFHSPRLFAEKFCMHSVFFPGPIRGQITLEHFSADKSVCFRMTGVLGESAANGLPPTRKNLSV